MKSIIYVTDPVEQSTLREGPLCQAYLATAGQVELVLFRKLQHLHFARGPESVRWLPPLFEQTRDAQEGPVPWFAIELDSAALHFIFESMQASQARLRSVVLCDDGPLS